MAPNDHVNFNKRLLEELKRQIRFRQTSPNEGYVYWGSRNDYSPYVEYAGQGGLNFGEIYIDDVLDICEDVDTIFTIINIREDLTTAQKIAAFRFADAILYSKEVK